jgi:hypothetical protein
MVLRMTGASWLASMMRAERDEDETRQDASWLLYGPTDPDVVEARERPERAAGE